jgi:hypothetical protein
MKILLITTTTLMLASPALAWNGTNTGSGQLVEQGTAIQNHTSSRSYSNAHANSSSRSSATGGNVSLGSGVGSNSVGVAPSITVPGGYGNASCGGGIGLGGIGLGGGGSGGGTLWEFHNCKVIREAAALQALGQAATAVKLLCEQIDDVRHAMGGHCDQIYKAPPDWCFTASPGERLQHEECKTLW